ncbi:hypothetical protein [Vagococcus elongatus]|nr:hypothetical protein [Vagococcus elongatus]
MKEIFKNSLIVGGVLLLFAFYIIMFTPFPILEHYNQSKKEVLTSLESVVEDELVVKEDVVYYKSTLHAHRLTAIYQKNQSHLFPIVYYHPLGSPRTDWLETEGAVLARQGYMVVELNESTGNDYSFAKTTERLTNVQEVIRQLAEENHSALTSFSWISEGIGSRIVLDYLLITNQTSDAVYLVNPYVSFEDMEKNSDKTLDSLAASKYQQAYMAEGPCENAIDQLKDFKHTSIFTTEDFSGQSKLAEHLENISFDDKKEKVATLERVPITSDVILQNR